MVLPDLNNTPPEEDVVNIPGREEAEEENVNIHGGEEAGTLIYSKWQVYNALCNLQFQ